MKFFHYVNCHNLDVYINIQHISSIVGKEVYVIGNPYCVFKHSLTSDELEELIEMIKSNGGL